MRRPASGLLVLALLHGLAACQEADDTADIVSAAPDVRMTPSVGGRGMAVTIGLRGINTNWAAGDLTVELGEGITIGNVDVQGPNHATAEVVIASDAALGFRPVSVVFPNGEAGVTTWERTGDEGFLVEAGGITIAPDRARLGESIQFQVTGFNTLFQQGTTWADLGEGIYVDDVQVQDETHAVVLASIDQRADPGYHDVVVFNGPNGYTLMDGLFVDRTAIAIEIDPEHGNQGETLAFTVNGYNTHFEQTGSSSFPLPGDRFTLVDLGREICVNEWWPDCQDNAVPGGFVSVSSGTVVTGELQISNAADVGFYDVRAYVIEFTQDLDFDGQIGAGEFTIIEDVILHDGFEVRPVPIDCNDNPGVVFGFSVNRDFNNDTCAIAESVSAYAVFYQPLDPPCGNPPQMPPPPFDTNGILMPPPPADCPGNRTCDAGEWVYLESELNTISLHREINPYTGDIGYYPVAPLTLEDYKFGYIDYDLRAEGSDDPTQIPAFTQPDALFTLPSDFEFLEPQLCLNFTHDPNEDLLLRWTPANTYDVAGLAASYSTADSTGQAYVLMVFPWDDGEYLWTSDWWLQLPEGGGNLSFGAGVNEPKWFLDFGQGPVGQENQGGSGLSYRGFMLLQSGTAE